MSTVEIEQRTLPRRGTTEERSAAERLLDWYDRERRELPWRYAPGETPDPYRVWLSEVMLQQTTVKAVIPYFHEFVRRWPKVERLAKAKLDDVLAAWAGLGYYSRARNLHACARAVVELHAGRFPSTEAQLRELPGIGPYTAAAIAAIAFGEPASPVDGNIERVVARLFAVDEPMPGSKPELRRLAATLTPTERTGDFAQAMMDLGAGVCTPKRPSCLMCPLQPICRAQELGIAATLPRRAVKPERPVRYGTAFVVLREDGYLLLRKRPEAGLLGGMLEVPSTTWDDKPGEAKRAMKAAPLKAAWLPVVGTVSHTFTHFRLELTVFRAVVPADAEVDLWAEPDRCRWTRRRDLAKAALPSLMRKVIAHALEQS
ncbi:MAG: A/G-specific adenine glycosylase [Proteobacteria bacterium]|nr:A/G-specific adenine glycosylase [Pseudomonadota bacterium]